MKNTLETRLGIFFALALVVAFLIMEMVGSFDFLKPGLRVRALFASVQELNVGDPVKQGGKSIGRVEQIELLENKVEVTMKLNDPRWVRTDTKATIRFAGLMGQHFVSLSFGSATGQPVEDRQLLESVEQPDLGALLSKLDTVAGGVATLTTNLSSTSFGELLGPLTDFIREERPRLSGIVSNVQAVTARIADGQGTVGRLVNDDALYAGALDAVTNFSDTAGEIQATVAEAREVVAKIRAGEGTIGKLATDPILFEEATAAVTNLKEILEKVNQGQGSVGKLVNDDTLLKNVRLSLQKLDKATESLEDQGPLSVIGIAVGNLF